MAIKPEAPRVKTFTLTLARWVAHRPGQHYDVRLPVPDGYQAQRSYSVASEPERVGEIDLTVERLEGGEVSSYMHDVLVPGDLIEGGTFRTTRTWPCCSTGTPWPACWTRSSAST